MSRTIRRKALKKHHSSFENDYTFDYVENWMDVTAWRGHPSRKMVGKEYEQAYHRYHRDTAKHYGWIEGKRYHDIVEVQCRAKNRQEIIRYMQNNEYEVINYKRLKTEWW